jgi:hypothetical protein
LSDEESSEVVRHAQQYHNYDLYYDLFITFASHPHIFSNAVTKGKLVKYRGKEGGYINMTYMCNFTKERQAKQTTGHVAAVQAKQAVTDQANLPRPRVSKNVLNTAVSSCGCLYRFQMQRFEALPGKLFISFSKGGTRSNGEGENPCHSWASRVSDASRALRLFPLRETLLACFPARNRLVVRHLGVTITDRLAGKRYRQHWYSRLRARKLFVAFLRL